MNLNNHVRILLDSYARFYGRDLITRGNDEAEELYSASIVVLSHDAQSNPVFNYANQTAQSLFEMDWGTFTNLPSRYSAEPLEREERERFLSEVRQNGYSNSYRGIRISATGRRFYIESAQVWNLLTPDGSNYGQAATFRSWTFL